MFDHGVPPSLQLKLIIHYLLLIIAFPGSLIRDFTGKRTDHPGCATPDRDRKPPALLQRETCIRCALFLWKTGHLHHLACFGSSWRF